jgi:hypothetical protein
VGRLGGRLGAIIEAGGRGIALRLGVGGNGSGHRPPIGGGSVGCDQHDGVEAQFVVRAARGTSIAHGRAIKASISARVHLGRFAQLSSPEPSRVRRARRPSRARTRGL